MGVYAMLGLFGTAAACIAAGWVWTALEMSVMYLLTRWDSDLHSCR